MGYETRKKLMKKIEVMQSSKVILYATSDRPGMDAQIANDAYDYFVHHLDAMWPSPKISLIIHTDGGNTSAAWRIVNLIHMFCDELEVIIPTKAHSAGTLISLGARKIILTKQATLGPIDPSLSGPLAPEVPGQPHQRVPVSVEVVQGYIDLAKDELGIADSRDRTAVLSGLSEKVHPLVLGQIFRTRTQIRNLADSLLSHQGIEGNNAKRIIDFLCADSGSHDRTINRREARNLGLNTEKPSSALYDLLRNLYEDFAESMSLRSRFDAAIELAGRPTANFSCERVLVESVKGGSARYMTEGVVRLVQIPQPGGGVVTAAETQVSFDGWRKM